MLKTDDHHKAELSRNNLQQRIMVVMIAFFVVMISPVVALENSYTEDFSSTTYKDDANTTAHWDTGAGELKLFPFSTGLVANYNDGDLCVGNTVSGNIVFAAMHSAGVRAIDITDPENPLDISLFPTSNTARWIDVDGNLVYCACDGFGLEVIDYNDPANPTLRGSLSLPGESYFVEVDGDLAYVACSGSGVKIIDISDPASPFVIGSVSTPGSARHVCLAGEIAYLADSNAGLTVIDISNKTAPFVITTVPTTSCRGVDLSGDYLYIADHNSGIVVFDVSDPGNPLQVGSLITPGPALGVTIDGDRLFASCYQDGFVIVDITDPANPIQAEALDYGGLIFNTFVAGEYLFVSSYSDGLQVIRFAAPNLPVEVNSITPFNYDSFIVDGNLGYSAGGSLVVWDMTDPLQPVEHGRLTDTNYCNQLVVRGDLLYAIIGYPDEFAVIDVSTPENPVLLDSISSGNSYNSAFCLEGDLAYFVAETQGMRVIDISDPTNLVEIGSWSYHGDSWRDIQVAQDYAYILSRDLHQGGYYQGHLQIVNVSDPTNPTTVSMEPYGDYVRCLAIDGNVLFIGVNSNELWAFDISNHNSPVFKSNLTLPYSINKIVINGDRAFVGSSVVDISSIDNISLIGTYPGSSRLALAGDYLYNYSYNNPLKILKHRQVDLATERNQGQGHGFGDPLGEVIQMRLTPTNSERVSWDISSDYGSSWTSATPDQWITVTSPGQGMGWRSQHELVQNNVNPTCESLGIEWRYEFGNIISVTDIPADQGGQVRLRWNRSAYDDITNPDRIKYYEMYRRYDSAVAKAAGAEQKPDKDTPQIRWPEGDWDSLGRVFAYGEDVYSAVVPTLADSTAEDGLQYSVYFIRAVTEEGVPFYDCQPDSGYSVDNLAPNAPANFNVTYGDENELSWLANEEEDFRYYKIYRGETIDFPVDPEALLHTTTNTSWSDIEGSSTSFYKISSVDFAGNESQTVGAEGASDVENPSSVLRFALHQNRPNPFNTNTTISFDLPEAERVSLRIYSIDGRLLNELVDEVLPAGEHNLIWDGNDSEGNEAISGVYFCHLTANGKAISKKMRVLK